MVAGTAHCSHHENQSKRTDHHGCFAPDCRRPQRTPATDPSQGCCDQSEDGVVKLGGDGHLYECKYIWGLGWYWMSA
jgi:hypothetical protein